MFIEVSKLLKCSFVLGPVHLGPIQKIKHFDGSIFYHQLLEDGSAEKDLSRYKQVNYDEVHPDNVPLIVEVREKLKSKYEPREST